MSAVGATTAPLRRPAGTGAPLPTPRQSATAAPVRSRAQLSVVASRPTVAGRAPFAVLIAGILLAGLMGLLLVHTLAAQDAFRVHDLNQRLATLKDSEQQLQIAAEQAESPSALRTQALALGMRPSQIDGYRHAKDGRVIGTLTAIPLPVIAPVPTPTATTKPSRAANHKTKNKTGTKPATTSKASTKAAAKTTKQTTNKAATTASPHTAHHAARHTGASHH